MPSRIDQEKLKALIKEKGYPSVAAFGRHIGVSESTFGRIFSKDKHYNLTQQTLDIIADGLCISTFELYKKEAIDEGVAAATAEEMAGAVVEAVTEAVTAVVADVAPEATPQEVAAAVPNKIPVNTNLPIDLVAYFDYLKTSHESEIKTLTTAYEDRIAHDHKNHSRLVSILCGVIAVMLVALLLK